MELTEERREQLARKGERLYEKSCRIDDGGACMMGFVEHHAERGEAAVLEDFYGFLHGKLEAETDPARLRITEALVSKITALLD